MTSKTWMLFALLICAATSIFAAAGKIFERNKLKADDRLKKILREFIKS